MSSDNIVIRINGLGKKYILGEKQKTYLTFRDAIVNSFKNPFKQSSIVNDFWALKNVSFTVEKSEVFGIIGKNGAGKSTLLKILSRITSPTTGIVEIKGRVGSLLEVGTGFHPELTGRENIFLNGSILGMKKIEIEQKFEDIVKFSEIEKFLDTPVKKYSSGMYVRLAFAVAAHLEPEILVVDEVLAVGDAGFQKKCMGKMGDVAKDGITVLFVSHNMGAIAKLCSKTLLLNNGSIQNLGETEEVIDSYINDQSTLNDKGVFIADIKTYKEMFISQVQAFNAKDQKTASFTHNEQISIEIECRINKWVSGTIMGFYVKDLRNRKVFTTNNYAWLKSDPGCPNARFIAKIPPNFLVPGQYVFTFAISIPNGTVLDWVEDAFQISIIDAGSDFSMYEGGDYGCVFANCIWSAECCL